MALEDSLLVRKCIRRYSGANSLGGRTLQPLGATQREPVLNRETYTLHPQGILSWGVWVCILQKPVHTLAKTPGRKFAMHFKRRQAFTLNRWTQLEAAYY